MNTKTRPHIYAVYKGLNSGQGHIQTESGIEKGIRANGNQKKAGIAILISDKID